MIHRQHIHVIGALACASMCALLPGAWASPTQDLQHLSLAQAYRIAEENNHDLRLSTLAVDSANAATVIAGAAPNPTLTLQTAGINPHLGVGAGSWRNKTVDTTIRIDQTIERGGKRALRMENAQHLEQAADKDRDEALRQLRISVGQAYYDVLAAESKRAIAQENAALYANSLAAAQKRLKAGDLSGADTARLQVDALRASNDAVQAEAELNKAQLALALLLGQAASARQIHPSDDWPAVRFEGNAPDAMLIDRRPDVMAAQSRLDAALASRKLALASRTRDVSVGLQYEHYPSSDANPQGNGNSYGISVQIPLFVRYHFDGEIRAAEAAVDAARENLEKVREQARAELTGSWDSARTSFDRIKRYDEGLLAAAKKSADAAEFAFRNGAMGVMDVLDARRTWRATQLDALAARTDFAKSLLAWQAAIPKDAAP